MAATAYHEISDIQYAEGLSLLEELCPNRKDKVLDIGCGTGRLTMTIAERIGPEGKVVGIDPDEERIKVAMDEKSATSAKNIEFLVADDQSFPEAQYDIAFCSNVIHWIKDKERMFDRVYKNLKIGGKFGIATEHDFTFERHALDLEVIELASSPQVFQAVKSMAYFEPLEYYKKLASDYCFEITHEEVRDTTYTFPSIDSFIEFLYGTLQGKFDKSHPALDDIKKRYKPGEPINWYSPSLTLILTKLNPGKQ